MKHIRAITIAALMALVSTQALATTAVSIKDLPDGTDVALQGTVEDFDSQHSLMLRDNTGAVKIDLTAAKPMVLKDGEKIDITGTVHHTILGSDVIARNVSEDKGLGQKVGEAIDSLMGQDAASSAQAVNVKSLPDSGFIKVNGVVDSVSSGKKFTLKDSTGSIDVAIKSGESASLQKGTPVTVIGNVNKGILSKSIDATEVDVRSDVSSDAD